MLAVLAVVGGKAWRYHRRTAPEAQVAAPSLEEFLAKAKVGFEGADTFVITRTDEYAQPVAARKSPSGPIKHVRRVSYKRPYFVRREGPKGTAEIQNGTLYIRLNLDREKVEHIHNPSAFGAGQAATYAMEASGFEDVERTCKNRDVTALGPYADTVDDTPCIRFDLEYTTPPIPELHMRKRSHCESLWFSSSDGLLMRQQHKTTGSRNCADYVYHVPMDDSFFGLPDWAKYATLSNLNVVARDGSGQPLPGARVYLGHLGRFTKATTDEVGRAEVPWLTAAIADRDVGLLTADLWDNLIVESADGTLAGLFTFRHLKLVFGQRLRELIFKGGGSGGEIVGERDFSDEGTGASVDYDPENNVVTLTMTLRPKAVLTGRFLDEAGKPITGVPVEVQVVYKVGGRIPAGYGDLDSKATTWPIPAGECVILVSTTENGAFEVPIPASHPCQVRFETGESPYLDAERPTPDEYMTLEPGSRVSLDEVVLRGPVRREEYGLTPTTPSPTPAPD